MRIVGGHHKGRPLSSPKGRSTRPTSDAARESLFNVLAHASWAPPLKGACVLDLFAGTGALGLEALSRGANNARFVEQNIDAFICLKANMAQCGVAQGSQAFRRDVFQMPVNPRDSDFLPDFVFLDPPYRRDLLVPALAMLVERGWITDKTIIIAESAKDEDWQVPARFELLDHRKWRAAQMHFLRLTSAEHPSAPTE